MAKTGILTITNGNAAVAETRSAILAELNPPAELNRASLASIVSTAMQASVLKLSFVIDFLLGKVWIFGASKNAAVTGVFDFIGQSANARVFAPDDASKPNPVWDVVSGAGSILPTRAPSANLETDFDGALANEMSPPSNPRSLQSLVAAVEDALLSLESDEENAVMVIDQDASVARVLAVQGGQAAAIASLVDASHVATVERAATATVPVGAFGL